MKAAVMFDSFGDPDEVGSASREEFDELERRATAAEDDLRRHGLHVNGRMVVQVPTPFGMKPAIAVSCVVGDLAFRSRVQDPEMGAVDKEFRKMVATDRVDGYLDAQAELRAALDEGRDPFAES